MRIIGFVGFQTKDLRSTGFRGNFVRGASKIFVCGTVGAVRYAVHTVFGDFPVTGVNVTDGRFMRLYPRHLLAVFRCAHQQMWDFDHAVIDKDHQRLTHLDRGCCPVALTDTDRNCITLVPRLFKPFLLPFAGRHVTCALFGEIDASVMAVAKFTHPLRKSIYPHIIGDLIEKRICRLFQRAGDIQMTMAPLFPVTVAFFRAGQLPPAWIEQAGITGNHARA